MEGKLFQPLGLVKGGTAWIEQEVGRMVDVDHSPDFLLNPRSAAFYQPEGLKKLAFHLQPGGVFGLWSNELPDEAFTEQLSTVFAAARAERVTFHNPLQNREST